MKATGAVIFLSVLSLNVAAETACPRTTADDPLYEAAFPGWYGTEGLAVELGSGKWGTTHRHKVLWRSVGFRPGTESNLRIEIKNLLGGPVTGSFSEARSFYPGTDWRGLGLEDVEAAAQEILAETDGWFMLTGADLPEPGCWEISAEYLGQTLTFVVETVDSDVDGGSAE